MTIASPLSLHIPRPVARPGDAARFDHISIDPGAATVRPDPGATEPELRAYPYGLVRVLGEADSAWDPGLDVETMRRGLRAMVQTRLFEDRLFRAHRQGKTSFFMKSTGEEAIGVAQ